MKLCVNCKHCYPWLGFINYRDKQCKHPNLNTKEVNPVNGEFMRVEEGCYEIRNSSELCGLEAKWWEDKFVSSKSRAAVSNTAPRPQNKKPSLEDLM